MKIMLKSNHYY